MVVMVEIMKGYISSGGVSSLGVGVSINSGGVVGGVVIT